MSSLGSAMKRRIAFTTAFATILVVVAGCSSMQARLGTADSSRRKLSDTERIAHVLSRLTFGARSGDAKRVAEMGIDRWIDQQLHPESIPDSAVAVALEPLRPWSVPSYVVTDFPMAVPQSITARPLTELMQDTAARAVLANAAMQLTAYNMQTDFFLAGKIIRAQLSERQLLEVMSEFWEDHFSVYSGKMPTAETLILYDRDILRPRALGNFRDLLGAVAHSPAMMFYLDNHLSTNTGLNENYARELLELHTLGVDGGYTQHDVIDVARAFTGWTINRTAKGTAFVFRRERHDTGTKTILGHVLPAGRGAEDGEETLDILARHASTAHHMAFKLARRLVSDQPPPSLVRRAAATFQQTDGDLAATVRTIVTSPEFFSRAAFRAKVKTPFELVVSARRALDAPADQTATTARVIARLGQPIFGWPTPEGPPDTGNAWMNSTALYNRIKFGGDMADGKAAFAPLVGWRDWAALSPLPMTEQIDGVVGDILSGCVEPATRAAMNGGHTGAEAMSGGDGPSRLRELLAIAFASPEFQRR